VPEFIFSRRFLQELSEFEKSASSSDLKNLEQTLAAIAEDPYLSGRVPSFYDPSLPGYLYRAGGILIHYRTTRRGQVEFLNLFWPKI